MHGGGPYLRSTVRAPKTWAEALLLGKEAKERGEKRKRGRESEIYIRKERKRERERERRVKERCRVEEREREVVKAREYNIETGL